MHGARLYVYRVLFLLMMMHATSTSLRLKRMGDGRRSCNGSQLHTCINWRIFSRATFSSEVDSILLIPCLSYMNHQLCHATSPVIILTPIIVVYSFIEKLTERSY